MVWEKGVCEVVRCVLSLWADWFQPAIRSISTAYITGEIYRSIVNGFPQQKFFWNGENDCVSAQSCLSRGGLVYTTSPVHILFPFTILYSLPVMSVYRTEMSRVFLGPPEHAFTVVTQKSFSNNCDFRSIACFRLVNQKLSMWCLANEHSSMIFGPQVSVLVKKWCSLYKVATNHTTVKLGRSMHEDLLVN